MSFAQRQQAVQQDLIGINRYNPQNVGMLEEWVETQITEEKYDPEANFTLLKLYQLNPDRFNAAYPAKILLKTLMFLPQSDTVLVKALIDSSKVDEPQIVEALHLSHLLETCQFPKFWETIREDKTAKTLAPYVGFEASIRNFISHVVSITYQNIKKDTLRQILGISNDKDLLEHCKAGGWEVKDDWVFVFNQEATVRSRNIEEKIELANIQDILKASAVTSERSL